MSKSSQPNARVVLLSPFYFPELISTGKANTYLGINLVERGCEVTAICSHPLYPDWKPEPSDATLPGMHILRGGAWLRYPKPAALRRMVLEIWFAAYAARRMLGLRNKVDTVVSIFPPSLFAVLVHALLPQRVRKVALVHDLQGVYAAQQPGLAGRLIGVAIHAVEQRAFRACEICIFLSHDMAKEAEAAYGLKPERIAVQYPFVTLPGDGSTGTALSDVLPAGNPHVVYSGALGQKQNPDQVLEFFDAAATRFPQAVFHIFSAGPIFDALKARYAASGRNLVRFHSLVPEDQLAELYARSAIQVIPQAKGTETGSLPSKLPNLLAAGVQILAFCTPGSEVGKLLQDAGTGTIVDEWEQDLFLERLGIAVNDSQAETASQRRDRTASVLSRFQIGNLGRLVLGTAK
jgi:glycosyltransferase involved in cell wall biosynthesis